MTDQPQDDSTIDIRNNPESRAGERDSSTSVARASDGGAPPKEGLEPGTQPDPDPEGTAGGDPLAGVTLTDQEAAEAVSGDTGPDELGGRGPGQTPTDPNARHA